MLVGAALQAASFHRAQLITGRVVSGVGLGLVNSTVPVLQAEFSPKASRGIYVCAQLSTLNFGIFLVYWIDYVFSLDSASYAWRIPVVLQCVCILLIMAILLLIPETPRWLAAHDRPDECLRVLSRMKALPPGHPEVQQLYRSIVQASAIEPCLGLAAWRSLLQKDKSQTRWRLFLACAVQSFQQLGGINAIVYYTNTLFQKSIGFQPRMSALMSGFLQTWFFLASFIPWLLIDRIGRRPLFLSMIGLMAAVMTVQAGLIYQVENETPILHSAAIGAAIMLFIFQGAFTVGFQATVWVYPAEILPLRIRQRGSSLSTAANWIFNYMIVQITPIAIERIGWRTYVIFAVLNTVWVPIIFFFFPETKGLELEDVDRLFTGQHFEDKRTISDPVTIESFKHV
ncbi:hypothetical protein CDD82_7209 [Ophiocordyceps australis]|uniref:Major facilitator superfamily (MFS) profile domain-containing protein n=1 Tax=Ophiocordyceps australis TaxID=1399860 RepID=A0A2C5XFB1_9HYPO|nr:hypothetical protein CDD82_7209 [Ophiocordyceps australis]